MCCSSGSFTPVEHVSIFLYHLVSKKQNAGLLCSITQTFSLCMWMYIHNLCEQTNYRLGLSSSYRWRSALCAQQHSWFSNPPTLDRKRIDSSDITGSIFHTWRFWIQCVITPDYGLENITVLETGAQQTGLDLNLSQSFCG